MTALFELLGVPPQALFGQVMLGLINGAFYAMLSLGLAVIFGLLNIINFAHGALYMLGAFIAWFLLQYLGLGYWWALFLAPLATVGAVRRADRATMLKRLYGLDPLYGLLLTFGLALIIQGYSRTSSAPPASPTPRRRRCRAAGISASCSCRTTGPGWSLSRSSFASRPGTSSSGRKLGSYLRAATENPAWCRRSASTCRG